MALTWSLSKISGYKNLCWFPDGDGYRIRPVTDCLIWATLVVGMGTITEKNWQEFCFRLYVWDGLHGPLLREADGTVIKIEPEAVKAHIGLRTNVAYESPSKWLKEMQKKYFGKLERLSA